MLDLNIDFVQESRGMFWLVTPNSPRPGGCLNKKDGLTRYGDSHVKDKTS